MNTALVRYIIPSNIIRYTPIAITSSANSSQVSPLALQLRFACVRSDGDEVDSPVLKEMIKIDYAIREPTRNIFLCTIHICRYNNTLDFY